MNKVLLSFYTFVIIICLSCQSSGQHNDEKFRLDVPHDSLFTLYPYIQDDIRALKLGTLEKGFESLTIRLWIYNSVSSPRKVIIIKRTDEIWESKELTYHWFTPENQEKLYKIINTQPLQPRSNWVAFIKILKQLGIERIPDHNVVKGSDHGLTDGIGYCVEYATRNSYRFFHYHCPYYFKDDFQEADDMTKLIDFLIKELNVTFSKC